jgi:hypothetical protein
MRRYGEDVTQEAIFLTLRRHRDNPVSYAKAMAWILHSCQYSDRRVSYSHHSTWGREAPSEHVGERDTADMWARATPDPFRLAAAREALRGVPPSLIAWAWDGATIRHRCGHPLRYWYVYECRSGHAVRCQQCNAERTAKFRGKQGGSWDG